MNREVKLLSTAWLLAATLLIPGRVQGAERQHLPAVHEAVIAFVQANHPVDAELRVVPDPLDRRLRLAPCERPLEAFWAPGSASVGHVTVGVRCDGARPWKLYVPTRVKLMREVVVAARPLARGQRLSREDLALDRRDVGRLRTHATTDPEPLVGYVLTRPVPAGRVLDSGLLEAPVLVERGRRVRMAVEGAGVTITMSGVALEDGALGDTVQVRNPASRRVVEGVVVGAALVRLGFLRGPQKLSAAR